MKFKSLFCLFVLLNIVILNTSFLASAGTTQLTSEGIVFPDGTKQTTAAQSSAGVPAPVPKTGQTSCYDASGSPIECSGSGQDGEYQKGVSWPTPRFTDNQNGTVTDNLTGLIWLKNAGCFEIKDWMSALSDANGLASGSCGLTDGSSVGDWRLPNRYELESLLDMSQHSPALPSGHPFTGLISTYWSSTSLAFRMSDAWMMSVTLGKIGYQGKSSLTYGRAWPVRGGQ